ncbi:MAG: hypothetical protein ABIO24_00595, partial [Saprospiraceae bacterium]
FDMKKLSIFSVVFTACICFVHCNIAIGQDTSFLQKNTWYFDNFNTPQNEIPWSLFRETFIGIAPDYNDAGIFDQLMFDELYAKGLFPPGQCFGLELMLCHLLRYGGHAGFCAPAPQYPGSYVSSGDTLGPSDLRLKQAIRVLHGHQINYRFIAYMLDLIAVNKNRDGNYVYSQYKYFEAKKEPMVLSITKELVPSTSSGGHVLLPYFAVEEDGFKKIFVHDVNHSFFNPDTSEHNFYTQRRNFVKINPSNGCWSYEGGLNYSGCSSGGVTDGNLIIMPFTIVGRKDRLPQSLFADAAEAIGKIFVLSQATELEQLSSPDGRRLFQPGMRTLELNDSLAMRSVLPFIPINGGQPIPKDAAQLYFVRGENDLNVRIKASASGYKIQLFSAYTSIKVESEVPGIVEEIQVRGWHTPNPVVELMYKNGKSNSVVEILSLHDSRVGNMK